MSIWCRIYCEKNTCVQDLRRARAGGSSNPLLLLQELVLFLAWNECAQLREELLLMFRSFAITLSWLSQHQRMCSVRPHSAIFHVLSAFMPCRASLVFMTPIVKYYTI